MALLVYAAYWAFNVRRALVGHIYRSQALWLGVLSLIVLSAIYSPSLVTNDVAVVVLDNLPVLVLALVLFAFVDSTVPVARRSDPLLRDTLRWGKVRVIAWSVLVLVEILGAYEQFINSNTGSNDVLGLLLLVVIGAPPMLVGARRSMDPNLRGCLKWFGVGLLSIVGLLLVTFAEVAVNISPTSIGPLDYGQIPYNLVVLLFGYCLYRSARSLAPINRLPPLESAVPSEVPGGVPPPPTTASP